MLFKTTCEISALSERHEQMFCLFDFVLVFFAFVCFSLFIWCPGKALLSHSSTHASPCPRYCCVSCCWPLSSSTGTIKACCKSALLEGTVTVVTKGGLSIPWSLYISPPHTHFVQGIKPVTFSSWTVTTLLLLLPPSILLSFNPVKSVMLIFFFFAWILWFWTGDARAMKLSTSADIFLYQ